MKIIKHDVISKNFDGRGNCWGTVARLPDGRIGAAWSGGRMGHVCPFGRLEMATSVDGNKFTMPSIVFDSLLDDRDAGLTAWGDKVVLTTFNNRSAMQRASLNGGFWVEEPALRGMAESHLNRISPEYEEKYLGSLLLISDDGETFNDFIKMPISAPHGPIALKNGKLFYVGHPFDRNTHWNGAPLKEDIYVMQTADGKNWSEPMAIAKGEDCKNFLLCEPNVVECENGDILLSARVHPDATRGYDLLGIALSRSTDGGKTFTPFEMTSFEGAPPHILKLKNGKLVLTYSRRIMPKKICARVSEDNGYTWGEEYSLIDLSEYLDMGYPSSVELDDGKILTAYYASNHYADKNPDNPAKFACVTWEL
ncbi:MAG: exo-alpha-sialidase [Clostridiales bacterium]|nr:exo-alpha-sialidase [Clostridiales bacterium]